MIVSTYRKLWCSSAQKINLIPHFFPEILKDFANLLFWLIWASLAMPNKINGINLYDSLIFICMQKINIIPPIFFEISGVTLEIKGSIWQRYNGHFFPVKTVKRHLWFQQPLCSQHIYTSFDKIIFEENKSLRAVSKSQIQFWPRITPWILQRYYKLAILGTLGMSGYGMSKKTPSL